MSVPYKIHTYASLPSTQDYVRELAEEGLPEGIVVQSLEQRKGRGRHGREWVSPIGNLYMSILLRPGCPVQQAGQLSFVAAVALSEAMDGVLEAGHTKTLKWPNDILIDGRKVSGILIEKEGEAYVVGMGVNVLSAPEDAVALKPLAGANRLAVHPFRDAALERLWHYYTLWQREGFAPIRSRWLAQAHGLGQPISVRVAGAMKEGIFKEIDERGHLVIGQPDGKSFDINSGEVYFPTGQFGS